MDSFLTNIFGGLLSQVISPTTLKSALRKGATVGLTAAAVKFGFQDTSWVPEVATGLAALGVFVWDTLQSTPGKLVKRTVALADVHTVVATKQDGTTTHITNRVTR